MAEGKKTRSKSNFFNLLDWKRDSKKKTQGEAQKEGKLAPLSLSDDRRTNVASVSSINDSKPASVVAKLMGLDSMPFFTSDASSSSFRSDSSQYSPQVFSHIHRMREGYFLECLEPRRYMTRYQSQPIPSPSSVPMRIRNVKPKIEPKRPSPPAAKKPAVPRKDASVSRSMENFKRKEFGGKSPSRTKAIDVPKKNGEKQKVGLRKESNPIGKRTNKPEKKIESRTKKAIEMKPRKPPSGIVAINKQQSDLICNPVPQAMDIVSFTFSSPIKPKSPNHRNRIDDETLIALMERRFEDRLFQHGSPIESADVVISLEPNTAPAAQEDSSREIEYVKSAINQAHIMFDELATGEASALELAWSEESGGRLMLDCSSEIIGGMCAEVCLTGMKKVEVLLERKEAAAHRIYKEIMDWKSMGTMMLDQVIYMDMTAKSGKWLDFQIEAFEEALHVVSFLFNSLIHELLYDFAAHIRP